MKPFSHWLHWYVFSPVCIPQCLITLLFRAKHLSSWLHWYRFSPVWLIWCLTRSPFWVKLIPHRLHWHGFPQYLFCGVLQDHIWRCNIHTVCIDMILPQCVFLGDPLHFPFWEIYYTGYNDMGSPQYVIFVVLQDLSYSKLNNHNPDNKNTL